MQFLVPLKYLIKQLMMMVDTLSHEPVMTLELGVRSENKDVARLNARYLYTIYSIGCAV